MLERINADLVDRIEERGRLFVSTSRVRGRYALRLCVLNHSTSRAEVDRALELAETLEVDLETRATGAVHVSYPDIAAGWLRRPTLDAEGCERCRCSPRSTTHCCDASCRRHASVIACPASPSSSSGRPPATCTSS